MQFSIALQNMKYEIYLYLSHTVLRSVNIDFS
jgi:hypothetical protein